MNLKTKRLLPLIIAANALLCFITAACTSTTEQNGPDPRKDFLEELVTYQIRPIYSELATTTATLTSLSKVLCAEITEENLSSVQSAWKFSRRIWKRAEVFSFGPVKEYPWRIGPKIDLWPVRPDEIEETLMKRPWADTNDLSLATGFSVGFPAIEYLIHPTKTSSTGEILNRLRKDSTRCVYLSLLAEDLEKKLIKLSDAWDPAGDNFADELINPNRDKALFKDMDSTFAEVTNQVGYTIENMREIKIAKPAGYGSGSPDPTLVESRISGNSIEDLRMNLEGIKAVYQGTYLKGQKKGLQALVPSAKSSVNNKILKNIETVEEKLNALTSPLGDAITAHPEQVEALFDALTGLQRAFQVDLLTLLGVTVGFNDTDGD
ncbi:MAG: imelysin family protein [Myxococcota bacterium]|nr:imelysin family protein [Myxococcota bacterium]